MQEFLQKKSVEQQLTLSEEATCNIDTFSDTFNDPFVWNILLDGNRAINPGDSSIEVQDNNHLRYSFAKGPVHDHDDDRGATCNSDTFSDTFNYPVVGNIPQLDGNRTINPGDSSIGEQENNHMKYGFAEGPVHDY